MTIKDLTPYKLLAFQYKPIEKWLKENLTPEQWHAYEVLPERRKMFILDGMAQEMGL